MIGQSVGKRQNGLIPAPPVRKYRSDEIVDHMRDHTLMRSKDFRIDKSMNIENNKVRVRFTHTAKGLVTSDGLAPTHFTIAGNDKTFHPATAVIDGNTVLVHSQQVAKPVAVRFAWSDTAIPILVNS